MNIALRYQELEEHNKKRARIAAAIFALLMILVLIFPFFSYLNPPPEQEGIMIAFGDPNAGGGFEEPVEAEEAETEEVEEVEYEEAAEPETSPAEPTPTPNPKPDVKTADNSKEIELKKKKEAERKKAEDAKKRKAEAEAKKRAEAKRKAEAEAKRKAAEEAKKKAIEEAKRKAGDKFKNKPGNGDGSNPGNAGDPNATKPGGGTGGGTTGSGYDMKGRSKVSSNTPKNPGVNGRVVIEICIDNKGNVISANYTQKGSNTTDGDAIKAAEESAKKWKFNADAMAIDKQCGTITYNFKVQ